MDVAPISEQLDPVDDPTMLQDGPTSAQLLVAFAECHNELAFEQLTRRLGPMVFGVCRRVVGNHHDAEEAFQATFLTLARHARRISCPEAITVWLHRVAFHTALRAKSKIKARQKKEMAMIDVPEPAVFDSSRWGELESDLDQELNSLPEIYREAVLLCDFEGKTRKEAAEQVGCPQGTFASRLSRAHELLANRLTRRGIVVTSTTLAVLLAQNAAMAAVPTGLVSSTVAAASTVSVLPTTFASVTASKLSSLAKCVSQMSGFGKVAVVGIAGSGMLATGLALQQAIASNPAPAQLIAQVAPGKLAAPFDEIVAAYRQFDTSIQSLRVEFQEKIEILQDQKALYEKHQIFPTEYEIPLTKTMAVDGENIAFREFCRSKGLNEVMSFLKQQDPNKFIPDSLIPKKPFPVEELFDAFGKAQCELMETAPILYDGRRFREDTRGVGSPQLRGPAFRPTYIFHSPTQIDWYAFLPLPIYLDGRYVPRTAFVIIAKSDGTQLSENEKIQFMSNSPAPFLKDDRSRKRYRLADSLEKGDWRVVSNRENVDGSNCVLIESAAGIRLWLDPAIGYAVRRMKWMTKTVEYSDFRNIADGLHIPGKYEYLVSISDNGAPAETGEPYARHTGTIVKLEVNEPISRETFTIDPPPGAEVVDTSAQPSDSTGGPNNIVISNADQTVFNYVQPANASDVASVIKAAQITDGPVRHPSSPNHVLRWLVLANAGILLVVAVAFVIRRKFQ